MGIFLNMMPVQKKSSNFVWLSHFLDQNALEQGVKISETLPCNVRHPKLQVPYFCNNWSHLAEILTILISLAVKATSKAETSL